MRIYHSLADARGQFGPCALTIGNFDGTHLAHQALFREVALLARSRNWTPAALSFNPHPAYVVAPDRAPKRITTFDQRCQVMASCGIERVLILPFTPELAHVSPESFVKDILVATLQTRAIVVGDNFRFGYKHAGDMHLLAELGLQLGFSTHIEPAIRSRYGVISSTLVREAVFAGRMAMAQRLLGRPYSLAGPVVPGHGIGSRQTVPTLNIDPPTEVLPPNGVYISRTWDRPANRSWASITNIGQRPTFHGDRLTIETFVIDPFPVPPPAAIEVQLLHRVRDERKFDSPEALRTQILRDVERARAYHRRANRWQAGLH
ncbi:MAG: bifunctional riboflavin kinase/FAD synthetase [Bryobacterales bacterium]|nr:bifunctional riboflavin kinase/FAD synthetase [Bryobacterales bacterium]